mgnify:CR=1 FL=1
MVILYNFFLLLLIYDGLGLLVGVLDGGLGLGFSVDGVWSLWCAAIWVSGLGRSI